MYSKPFLVSFITLALCACAANSFQVVEPPLRNAALYPLAQAHDGVTVAADEFTGARRSQSYFGADLPKAGILPVNITVSNQSGDAYRVGPSDVLLRRQTQVIDPLRTQAVAAIVEQTAGGFSDKVRSRIRNYLAGISFNATVVAPHQSYQGVLFFPVPRTGEEDEILRVYSLFGEGVLQMDVMVTNRDTRNTLRFGPFMLRGITVGAYDDSGW